MQIPRLLSQWFCTRSSGSRPGNLCFQEGSSGEPDVGPVREALNKMSVNSTFSGWTRLPRGAQAGWWGRRLDEKISLFRWVGHRYISSTKTDTLSVVLTFHKGALQKKVSKKDP